MPLLPDRLAQALRRHASGRMMGCAADAAKQAAESALKAKGSVSRFNSCPNQF